MARKAVHKHNASKMGVREVGPDSVDVFGGQNALRTSF
jgi:hypothetical protein